MPKSQVETYTISSNPSYSSNIPQIEIPATGNDIKIIITEPSPTDYHTSPRIHYVESKPTSNRTLTRFEPSSNMYEVIEMPSTNRNYTNRRVYTDFNNTSFINRSMTDESFSTTSDRYLDCL